MNGVADGPHAPWREKLPSRWEMIPGLASVRENKRRNTGMVEDTVLSLSYGRIVIKPPEKLTGLVPESFETYQVMEPGDIVIRTTDLQNDWTSLRVGLVKDHGIITSAYVGLKPTARFSPEFLYYLLHSYDTKKVFYGMGSGLRQNIGFDDFKWMPFICPPRPEQDAIVAYLDGKLEAIDRYLRVKEREIALLEERKRALIHRAVTRGLDPNPQLQPSGIPWLPEIPVGWEMLRLKALIKDAAAGPYGSSLTKAMYTESGFRVYGQQQVIPNNFHIGDYYIPEAKFLVMQRYRVSPGDLLISVMGTVGRAAVVPNDAEQGIINPRLVKYQLNTSKILPRFAEVSINSVTCQAQLIESSKGTTMEGLNMQILGNLQIAVPPLALQAKIVAFVDDQSTGLGCTIARARQQIERMQEYRTALIAEAVTGKINVNSK